MVLAILVAACGGDDSSESATNGAAPLTQGPAGEPSSNTDGQPDQSVDDSASGPVGPAEPNTFVVGNDVWIRRIPMTEGQCFLPAEDGGDPVNGTAWGPMEGDDVSFSVDYAGEGSGSAHEAEVRGANFWWAAGSRVGTQDLVVEIDHDTMTISGSGTFSNLQTGETAPGSFNIKCEEGG